MAVKKIGTSPDLIIHPGETIADILIERGISQAELAARAGVSAAYVSYVIAGKKDISANFAMGLEYALGVPKSFWLNLQANYDAELLELNEAQSVTDAEILVCDDLKEIVKHLRQLNILSTGEKKDALVLSLRKVLRISNLVNLKDMINVGAFRIASNAAVNPYVLGAWIRLCQMAGENSSIASPFELNRIDSLVTEIKQIMLKNNANIQADLKVLLKKYGIDFAVVKNFRGAPVQGYLSQKNNGTYQMVLTIRGSFADIFWFSLFHELGHIVNGDIGKTAKFIDDGGDLDKEKAADLFASSKLLEPESYSMFVNEGNFSIDAISKYALSQNVMPYIVIGRLQKEKHLDYRCFSEYKLRYKWAK